MALLETITAAVQLTPVEQDHLDQARQMQAMSFAVHIPLTCFGVAFPALILFVEWLHLRTGDPVYRRIARRWSRIMVALFAVGVVTGTILSFELGMLWPNFMGSFGDVFGLGFAIEGFAFFLEAIFIAIYVYGWDRMKPRHHFLSGIPIVLTGMLGAAMVIAVNGWMNHPGGFDLAGGQIENVRPWAALFGNTFFWHELIHMYVAAYIVVGFLLAGAYAWGKLRGRWGRYERIALTIPLTVAAVAAPVQLLVGDWAAREVASHQPVKLAALEGLQETTKGAPEHILGWYDKDTGEIRWGISIPKLLSFLSYHDPNATVRGLDAVPPDDRPGPINTVRFAFQGMVGIGTGLAALAALVLFFRWRKKRLPESVWFDRALVLAGPGAVVALICGWVVTEVGRQPWIVYEVMRVDAAVTGAGGVPVGYGLLALVYVGLLAALAWILRRLSKMPLHDDAEVLT
ncbi:cytochrome ubiquinol oxidase subunit I [Conexibacter sp. JD483]|uniref:cytochrome ubiquinol oxidase subunit I n=1 Tax=unclassified Conexibacter TaxID=2627773 RepID=UPI00271933E4|nr:MULTISPECIES: cytochrome ubiquinol oxidase subunit I [unclassified Conexibacter]MDO8184568.1 cytochrome ubiquinol oxidase subunit I [Conexibacter sp. CPCC 205706]MDO8197874.1 cytochrome ubiquinol oxidase subunit I [Conexibacter sp. CPCC 205762]MDR9370080.1 cytochrome ubiquinol oxidase subunit I [Conexibacter sp. JD483]